LDRGKQKKSAKRPADRQRLSPSDRKDHIISEAVKYFSEVGFDAGTRPLAVRLGVTQPLIFKYFPNKEDLIQAVYEKVFLSRWRIEWEALMEDRSRTVRDRLIDFYTGYLDAIFTAEWMRIFMFAGLKGLDINRWYIRFVEDRIHRRFCRELRIEMGLDPDGSIDPREFEMYWTFHGGLYYYGVRRDGYGVPVHLDLASKIEVSVDALLRGMPAILKASARK
jgi:AcrR family transcriptional regulator